MKYLLIVVLTIGILACQSNTQDKVQLKTLKDSVSYSIGMSIGQNLKMQQVNVEPAVLAEGIKDILDSSKTLMTDQEAQTVMMNFQKEMMAKQEEKMKAQGEINKTAGENFLSENKKKEDVVALPNGLQYKVIKMGNGPKPKATDTVSVHYRGTLIDGTEFDSSIKRGQPATFPLNGVIKGWTEGLQLMPVGSKFEFFVPSDLAYGDRGAGQLIGPNSTLIFEVELLFINGK
ncbi:MAG: FKBP-type peptidyl-prolyl cis-trans isomerase [Ignavibacteriales bacterium]|nr:FKBP-type peptidyl-prolyl cis-trans isomerase [Ignavibacteriales bacterium]